MGFLILGIALLVLKLADFGFVATWAWWIILAPFGLAVLWWGFVDATGVTQRRAMAKMDKRKADRRERALEDLGLKTRPTRGVRKLRDSQFHGDDGPSGKSGGQAPPR